MVIGFIVGEIISRVIFGVVIQLTPLKQSVNIKREAGKGCLCFADSPALFGMNTYIVCLVLVSKTVVPGYIVVSLKIFYELNMPPVSERWVTMEKNLTIWYI